MASSGRRGMSSAAEAGADGPQVSENVCPDCAGSGRAGLGGAHCSTCDGDGVVLEPLGDA